MQPTDASKEAMSSRALHRICKLLSVLIVSTFSLLTPPPAMAAGEPVVIGISVPAAGTEIDVSYDVMIRNSNYPPNNTFIVLVDGAPVTVTGMSRTNNTHMILDFDAVITSGQVVTVEYVAPTPNNATTNLAVQNSSGVDALSLPPTTATNNSTVAPDAGPPVFSSATTNSTGSLITITYTDENNLSATKPGASAFEVQVDGVPNTVSSISISGKTAVLSMSSNISAGRTIRLTYTAPNSDNSVSNLAIQDITGKDAAGLLNQPVTNNSTLAFDSTGPTAASASIPSTGTTVPIVFSENLASATAPASAFSVLVGGDTYSVLSTSVSGKNVTLTLAGKISSGRAAVVSYNAPASDPSDCLRPDIP